MLKRIYAVVSEDDFYTFQQRARKEGMDMGQALAAVTHAYAKGELQTVQKVKAHSERFDYIKAHEDPKPRLAEVQGDE